MQKKIVINSKRVSCTFNQTQLRKHSDSDLPYRGTPGGHDVSPDGTKERWWGDDGLPLKDRHYTDHGNPVKHPWVPHDHDWNQKPNGHWEPGPGYPTPKFENQIINTIAWCSIAYGGYQLVKWGIAISLVPTTGGGSFIIAGVMP